MGSVPMILKALIKRDLMRCKFLRRGPMRRRMMMLGSAQWEALQALGRIMNSQLDHSPTSSPK